MEILLVCDAMIGLEGGVRPAICLANELVRKGGGVSILAPIMSSEVENRLRATGITPINLRVKLFARKLGSPMLWFELWGREAFFRLNSKRVFGYPHIKINFSHTLAVPSEFLYLQGPTSAALRDGETEFSGLYKFAYKFLKPIIDYADENLAKEVSKRATYIIANSKFCASIYERWGIRVKDVVYPPVDRKIFRPCSNPSSDYVLTYFGRETKFSIIKAVADLGISIKAFGAKPSFTPKSLIKHPQVEFLGRVSTNELVNLYSNALYTLFPFTHEPFGYIPVESMCCGTPTLTYDAQGPSETIVNGYNGWLVTSDDEIVRKALSLWKDGYDQRIRINCLKEAKKFDEEVYLRKWLKLLAQEYV